jgi:hypothetical protein
MTVDPDITATIIFHREGAFALPALASLWDSVSVARAAGITVETQAILDRPDKLTRHVVEVRGAWLDVVEEVSIGDLGLIRNAGTRLAHGRFLAFLDGDDLWGEQWLRAAFEAATSPLSTAQSIWHPECVYYFSESDFDRHAIGETPHPSARSFYVLHQPSDAPGFNQASLVFNHIWTANVFCRRELHVRHPYGAVDRFRGFGVEDWSWNFETLWKGIPHSIVHSTVHIIRIKEAGSLSRKNAMEGLLPSLPKSFVWGKDVSKIKVDDFERRLPEGK